MRTRPLYLLPFDHVGAEQSEWDGATEEIIFTRPAGQVFRCAHESLHRIEVFIEPTFHYKRCHLWLSLYAEDITERGAGQRGAPIRIAGPLAAEQLVAHGWIGFEFQPVSGSAGKTFTAIFESPDATPGQALSLRATVSTAGPARGLLSAGAPRPGALAFRAVCLRAPELWPNFVRFRHRARERTAGVDYRPLLARLEISRPCNLHCVMCLRGLNPYDAKREGTAFMSPATFQALDPLLPDLLWLIAFGLGEPFLNPHYLGILRHARARNAHVHIFTSTNGTCLDQEKLTAIVSERLLSTLQISLDGAERETFEAIRVKASFDTVLQTIERAAATRARERASDLHLRGAMLVMKSNVDQIFTFIRLMAERGVDYISLDSPKGGAFTHLRADGPDDMARIYEQVVRGHESLANSGAILDGVLLTELHEWHRRTGQTGDLPRWGYDECAELRDAQPKRTSACPVPWESFNLAADGEVRVCCNSNRHMGQLPAEPISTVWEEGRPFGRLREELVHRRLHQDCHTCLGENIAIPGELTPPQYLTGCVANAGATAWLAGLLGATIAASDESEERGFSANLETIDAVACEANASQAAIAGYRLRGSLSGAIPADGTLVLSVNGVPQAITAPVSISKNEAQWAAWLEAGSAPIEREVTLHLVQRAATGALLRRVPLGQRPIPGCELRPAQSNATLLSGFVDKIEITDGFAHVTGWVRDGASRVPAYAVTATMEGRPVRSTRPSLERPDVASFHGDEPARFGFSLELPLDALATHPEPRRLVLLARNDRGETAPLAWPPSYELIHALDHPHRTLRIRREGDTTWIR